MQIKSNDTGKGEASSLYLGKGEPLQGEMKEKLEAAYSTDFSNVRVHKNAPAAATKGAAAFTSGNDMAFAPGRFDLHTAAHEAAHVVQQRTGAAQKPAAIADSERNLSAHNVAGGGAAVVKGPPSKAP